MNSEDERERSSGGDEPVASDDSAGPCRCFLRTALVLIVLLLVPVAVSAQRVGKAERASVAAGLLSCAEQPSGLLAASELSKPSGLSACAEPFYLFQSHGLPECAEPLESFNFFVVSEPSELSEQGRTRFRKEKGAHQRGLSLSLGAGVMFPSDRTANFYNGSEGNANTIYRVLHSERYGYPIWLALTDQNLISDAIGSYSQLAVAEYGDMNYRVGVQLQFGFRYDYAQGWGWLLKFDYTKLLATGAFLIDATNGTGILSNSGRYITCPIEGEEKRIFIDAGLSKRFRLDNGFDIGVEGGVNISNVKVESNDIQVANTVYNILDLWNGQSPSSYTQDYEYINQGGLGVGGFATVDFGLTLPDLTALTMGYTCYYTKINLQGYSQHAFQHLLFLRVDINNFDFLGL